MQKITALQIEMRFAEPQAGGVIDLRDLDFRHVNMQEPAVKENFRKIAKLFDENKEDPPFYIDMSGSNISGSDIRGFNLSNVVMTGVEAHGTVFINANMSDIHIDQADLTNADFRQADLYHAKFYESDITGANFSGADMRKVHGLGLRQGSGAIDRLGVASTIRDALLPENMEKYRERIQEKIREKRQELPQYAADLIEYDSGEAKQEGLEESKPVIGYGFFNLLRKKKNKESE
jgi:uncharacterized protein YjbI with pentapeptide repeats